jgi:hypothetical protein
MLEELDVARRPSLKSSVQASSPLMAPVVIGALKCAHQSLHSSGGAVKALTRSDNLNLDDATLTTTAHTVDGVDAEPAADKQPGHQKLSHRIPLSEHACQSAHSWVFGSGNLPPAQKRVLRPSGGSEGMLSAMILKPHQSALSGCRIAR